MQAMDCRDTTSNRLFMSRETDTTADHGEPDHGREVDPELLEPGRQTPILLQLILGVGVDLGNRYELVQGVTVFGFGNGVNASSFSGDAIDLRGTEQYIGLPPGYVSGAQITTRMTFAGQTFQTLGVIPRASDWFFGDGQTVTLRIGSGAAVPEPSALALGGIGLAAFAGYGWEAASLSGMRHEAVTRLQRKWSVPWRPRSADPARERGTRGPEQSSPRPIESLPMNTEPVSPEPTRQKLNVKACLAAVAIIVVVVVALVANHDSRKARVSEWAAQNGYSVVGEVRTRSFLEPCPFVLDDEHDDVYRAELEDAGRQKRTAWFRFHFVGMEQAWE
ncbi:PEP-CTERM sorting domain-containing protein [Paludisphaera mucosa]|uniref:PEP-CTERM sorting domain-containing protein n=1 Tax=Paludisphaera mucosa TaxID=3030827 RepID=A0ABT6FEH9_9BACT|nr:PEP-CTERM sorting domain-containing protein [Paludisphaera mucosa]MDG3005982.1 PEP-CTERM sorting domain-containing protein [Paludisphaera mucosa]